ncbi:MAG: 1-phosphofructokinase [Acutalibacter sp.]|jgi:1-phosphofructokinase
MIITVTLNPALDYAVSLPQLRRGEIQWFGQGSFVPGGKGVNVSQLLTSLGVENRAVGIAAGFTGREILRRLETSGCSADFVLLEQGESRLNVKLTEDDGTETGLNGGGPQIPPEAVAQLLAKLDSLSQEDILVLSGSLPQGLPEQAFPQLLEAARRTGVRLVVDMSGDPLLAALPYRPFLIKPNGEELGAIFGIQEPLGMLEAADCAGRLQRMGARNVLVSLGGKGALLLEEGGRRLYCHAVRGDVVSTVGAGDSMVAGFLYGLQLHGTLEGGLRWGVAAGGATAFQQGIASGERVKALFPAVENPHVV